MGRSQNKYKVEGTVKRRIERKESRENNIRKGELTSRLNKQAIE